MRILLVLPAAAPVRRRMLRLPVLPQRYRRRGGKPLTTVAALTPARHEVRLCDEHVEAVDLEAEVDLVGLSFMTAAAPRAYEIARAFRRRGVTVVAGGDHPTVRPREVLEHVDAVVIGEAGGQWPRLLEDAEACRLQREYRASTPCDPALVLSRAEARKGPFRLSSQRNRALGSTMAATE